MNITKRFSLFTILAALTLSQALVAGQHEAPASNGGISSWFKYILENKATTGALLAAGVVGGGAVYVGSGYLFRQAKVDNKQKMLAVTDDELAQLAGDDIKKPEAVAKKPEYAEWLKALAPLFSKEITLAQIEAKLAQPKPDPYVLLVDVEFMTKLIETGKLADYRNVLTMYDAHYMRQERGKMAKSVQNQPELATAIIQVQDLKELLSKHELSPKLQDDIAELLAMQAVHKEQLDTLELIMTDKDQLGSFNGILS